MKAHRTLSLLAALTIGAAGLAGAQVTSSLQSVTLGAVKGGFVTLGVPAPTSQTVNLTDGAVNQYSSPFSITVTWDVTTSATTTVKLVGYFDTPAQALANGGSYIPASSVEVSTDGGANWSAVTDGAVGTVGTSGGSKVLYTSPVTQGSDRTGTHSVTFLVRINLLSGPTTTAGNYAGTLNLMSICN